MFYQQVCLVLFRTCIIRKEFSQRWKEWLSIIHQVRKLEGLEQERNGCNFQLERRNSFSLLSYCEYLIYVKFIIFSSNRQPHYWSQQPQDSIHFPMWPRHNLWIAGEAAPASECTVLSWDGSVPVTAHGESSSLWGLHDLLGLMQMCRAFGLSLSAVPHTTDSREL